MSRFKYKSIILKLLLGFIYFISCKQLDFNRTGSSQIYYFKSPSSNATNYENSQKSKIKSKALLSSRFRNLDQLKNVVKIKYAKEYSKMDSSECLNSNVTLTYISNNDTIIRKISSGISQNELLKLQKSSNFKKLFFVFTNPSTISQRKELEKVYILARRKIEVFGPADVSFYDLALASFRHINTPELAYLYSRDSSEKGYINTFNHVTAQAIITFFFSESLADLIGDLHERNNMPEITSGRFSMRQLNDSLNSPEDNYIDIINNEIGQKLGIVLKEKYTLYEKNKCTPILLSDLMNDIHAYYIWALKIGMNNFRPSDEIIINFSTKINSILSGTYTQTLRIK